VCGQCQVAGHIFVCEGAVRASVCVRERSSSLTSLTPLSPHRAMTTADEHRPRVGEGPDWTLPPSWEALKSEKDNRTYYWNKKTGATTWKFPEKEGEVEGEGP